MIPWRTTHHGLWRTVNPGLLFGAILVALVLVPWWAFGQSMGGDARDKLSSTTRSLRELRQYRPLCDATGGRIRLNNTLETGTTSDGAASASDLSKVAALDRKPTQNSERTAQPKTSRQSSTPTPTPIFPHGVRAKTARHWHCWLGSACRTRECVESPLGCNGVPMAAWGTDPDLCQPPEQCVYFFCDGVSRELVAVPRHLCLATGGDTPEWPLP